MNEYMTDTERYDLTIDALTKTLEAIDKYSGKDDIIIFKLCKQNYEEVKRDIISRGELCFIFGRICELMSKNDQAIKKHLLMRIKEEIEPIVKNQQAKELNA